MPVNFQTSLNRYKPWGTPGDLADSNYNHFYPITPLVAENDTGVTVGKFVWVNGTDETCTSTGTGMPTGIVHRILDNPLFNIKEGASMNIPVGYKAAVVDVGSIFVAVSDTPAIGNKLFVNNTTGAITNAAAGTTVSGATETSFKIISLCDNAAAAGLTVIVTNWGVPATVATEAGGGA